MIRVLVVTAGASLVLTSAAQGAAFTQLPGAAGCLMQIDYEVEHGCGRVGGLDGAQRLTLSPDDRFVYVASGGTMFGGSNGVVTFRRDPSTGALTKAGCVTATSGDGRAGTERACTRGDALIGAADLDISADGRLAFVASSGSSALAWFTRDPASGALTPAGCVKDFPRADRCSPAPPLRGASAVAASPDGADVYVASPTMGSIQHLRRDAAGYAPAGCVSHTGSDGLCAAAAGLQGILDVVMAPDGRAVYAVDQSGAVTAFARDPGSGALTQTGCLLAAAPTGGPCRDAGGIAGAAGLAVSPDSRDVYVASQLSDAVAGFRVQPDGSLRQTDCLQRVPSDREDGRPPDKRCRPAVAVWDPQVVTVSADGRTVFAGGADTVSSYRRDPSTGLLTQIGCAEELQSSPLCLPTRATFGVNGIAASGDGRSVYVTAAAENAVAVLGAAPNATATARRRARALREGRHVTREKRLSHARRARR